MREREGERATERERGNEIKIRTERERERENERKQEKERLLESERECILPNRLKRLCSAMPAELSPLTPLPAGAC